MKHFLKGFTAGFLIGIPLIVIFIIFLYSNQSSIRQNPVEETMDMDSDGEKEVSEDTFFLNSQDDVLEEAAISNVTLAFAGDVNFSEQILSNYDKSGVSALADEEMLRFMQNADLFMLNNEFAFSLRGEPMEDKQYTLRTDPKYVTILKELGTDVVSIANNHVLDFGREAFGDTLDTLKQADIAYAGGGQNMEEASSPVVRTINGQTFAIFAATRVSPSYDWYATGKLPGIFQTYDAAALNKAISDAENRYDHTIVFVHWGVERNETPEEYQRTLARGYIDAGADLVVGCHPHVLQGFEYYQGVPIVYSLGNYLFGNRTGETILLNAEFAEDGKLTIRLIPCQRINGVLTRNREPENLFSHLTDLSFDAAVSMGGILIPAT